MAEGGSETCHSDTIYDYICQPCQLDGKVLEAEGRCEDCDDYLCKRCFVSHTIPRPLRNHVLISLENIQKDGTPTAKIDQCTQRCPLHTDEIIKYYCSSHSFLGCSACIILKHKTCEDTVYIPDVAKDLTSNTEFKDHLVYQQQLEQKATTIALDAGNKIEETNLREYLANDKIRSFRKEIDAALDDAETKMLKLTGQIKLEQMTKWTNIQYKSKKTGKEVSDIHKKVKTLEKKKQFCNLYIEMRKNEPTLKDLENSLKEIDSRNDDINENFFNIDYAILDLASSSKAFGTIGDKNTALESLNHYKDVDVNTKTDTVTCWISSSLILEKQKVMFADFENNKLKIVDIRENKVSDEKPMSSAPWDMTYIDNGGTPKLAAVTLPYKNKVVFVNTHPKLKEERTIDVGGQCRGIAYFDEKLIVTYEEPEKVSILDMQGSVTQTILPNENGNNVLSEPFYLAVNPKIKHLYISNAKGGHVLFTDNDGNLLEKYTDDKLKRPVNITIDGRGMVYTCDWTTHTVHQFTHDCKQGKILLTETDGIKKPYTMSIDEESNMVYIGMRDNNQISVFRANYV